VYLSCNIPIPSKTEGKRKGLNLFQRVSEASLQFCSFQFVVCLLCATLLFNVQRFSLLHSIHFIVTNKSLLHETLISAKMLRVSYLSVPSLTPAASWHLLQTGLWRLGPRYRNPETLQTVPCKAGPTLSAGREPPTFNSIAWDESSCRLFYADSAYAELIKLEAGPLTQLNFLVSALAYTKQTI
jgi:hypothetical protein